MEPTVHQFLFNEHPLDTASPVAQEVTTTGQGEFVSRLYSNPSQTGVALAMSGDTI
jgi:hypothetical protein